MSLVRGLIGFMAGAAIGGLTLAAITTTVPQFQGTDTAKNDEQIETAETVIEETVEENIVSETTETVEESPEETVVEEPGETVVKGPEEVTVEEPKVEEEQKSDVPVEIVEEADTETATDVEVKSEDAVDETPEVKTEEAEVAILTDEPESEDVVGETDQDAPKSQPETTPDEIKVDPDTANVTEESVSEEAQITEESTKITLPTIEPEAPAEPTEDIAEEVVEEPEQDAGITIGQKPDSSLPTITTETPEPSDEDSLAVSTNNALEFNAIEFEDTGSPLLVVILQDIGNKGLSIDKLNALSAPITIAIPADDPNASQRALEYNAAGYEVIAMASRDASSTLNSAKDTEQVSDVLNVIFSDIPNAIGLLDSFGGLQKNRRSARAVIENFAKSGHGLITYSKGLNSTDRDAIAGGVRANRVVRILDENGENKSTITRYLDRVALDAGRDGSVVVIGTTAQETVATLAAWALSSKGQSVTLAPASAVLLRK